MKKRIIYLLLLVMMGATVMTGCGSKSKKENKVESEQSELEGTESTEIEEVEYDDNGNILLETYFEKVDGKLVETMRREYEYNSKNLLVKESVYQYGELSYWYEYEYDDNGNLLLENAYDADGEAFYWHKYEYDDKNHMTMEISYGADGTIDKWCKYVNEYDNSNILQKVNCYNIREILMVLKKRREHLHISKTMRMVL